MIKLFSVNVDKALAVAAATRVLYSGWLAEGKEAAAFEAELAEDVRHEKDVVLVNSGTSALWLAYHLAGVKRKTRVVVSPVTCAATALPLLHMGAEVVWADVDPATGLIDPTDVAKKVKSDKDVIVGTAWGGTSIPVTTIWKEVSDATRGLEPTIIEDAAHKLIGNHDSAQYAAYSFQAIKFLTTGDGGALVLPKEEAARARRLRWFGFDRTSKEDFRSAQALGEAGYKFHMNDLAAAIGRANLPAAKAAANRAWENATYYFSRLTNAVMAVGKKSSLLLGLPSNIARSDYWLYTIRVGNRDAFVAFMRRRGIECSVVHSRLDKHPVFKGNYGEPTLRGVDDFCRTQVSIPVGAHVTDEDREVVANAVEDWATGAIR